VQPRVFYDLRWLLCGGNGLFGAKWTVFWTVIIRARPAGNTPWANEKGRCPVVDQFEIRRSGPATKAVRRFWRDMSKSPGYGRIFPHAKPRFPQSALR